MVVHRYVAQIGTDLNPVRGGHSDLCPLTRDARDARRSCRVRTTNRRGGPRLGVGKGELSLCRNAVSWFCGPRLHSRSRLTKDTNEHVQTTIAFSSPETRGSPWPTQGVDSKTQNGPKEGDALGFGKERGLPDHREADGLADPIL
jgi:hypothetical protein